MLQKLANIFRIPDLRKRILFTLAMLAVYRLGAHIPTPGVDPAACDEGIREQKQLIGEETTKTETQRPHMPPSLRFGIAP